MFDKMVSLADGNNYRIFVSQTQDAKKNPLGYAEKIKFMRKMFPKLGRNIIEDDTIKNILGAASQLSAEGYSKLTMVVGADRVDEFTRILNVYHGSEKITVPYHFKDGISIVSAGFRDPDTEDVEGMSSSKMRQAAIANDLIAFSKGLPTGFGDTKALFNAVRDGLGLKESYSFRKHVQLTEVSSIREDYVAGKIFKIGDPVEILESHDVCTVVTRGSNYIVATNSTGNRGRFWLTDVCIPLTAFTKK